MKNRAIGSPDAQPRKLGFEPLESRRLLATFTVTNLLDGPVDAIGQLNGSLRQALFDANTSPGLDTIEFSPGLSGSVLLTAGDLLVDDGVTITGPGASQLTIDAQRNSRVFTIDDGNSNANQAVEISGLTLTGGSVASDFGGGVLNREALTLTSVVVINNETLGATGHGGGIFTEFGTLTLNSSTVANNIARGNNANGGGLFIRTATSTIENSTFSGNSAGNNGGGIFNVNRAMTINHSTIVDNQVGSGFAAGVASGGNNNASTQVYSSIISGNGDGTAGEVDYLSGSNNSFVSLGYNLVGSGNAIASFNAAGDQTGISNPLVGPLSDNGGETPTHELLPVSLAIDAGDPSLTGMPDFDQRGSGFERIVGEAVDIGAVERQVSRGSTFTVTNLDDLPVATSGSLRRAILNANATPGADTIVFEAGLSGTIFLNEGELLITEAVTILGPGSEVLSVDGRNASRIFNVDASVGDFGIVGLSVEDGQTFTNNGLFDSSQSGGAIRSVTSGVVALNDVSIDSSRTSGRFADGGALFAKGDVFINDATFRNNYTEGDAARGGSVFAKGSLTLVNSELSNNLTFGNASVGGGAVALGALVVKNSEVSSNGTSGLDAYGGGLFALGSVSISDSEVSNNYTRGNRSAGGGLFTIKSATVQRTTFRDNRTLGTTTGGVDHTVAATGGAIRAGGNVLVESSTISGNSTSGNGSHGGGIYALGNVELLNSTISGNSTSGNKRSTVESPASNGGGVFVSGNFTANHSTVYGNNVLTGSFGGGVVAYGGLALANSIVAGNTTGDGQNADIKTSDGQVLATFSLIGSSSGTLLDSSNPGTNAIDVNAALAPLADNGGPTETHALAFNSPAINSGDPSFVGYPKDDQRGVGFSRVFNGRIDMGAYERQLPPPEVLIVDTLVDENDGNHSAGDLSLREALLNFSSTNPGEPVVVAFDPGLAGGTITLSMGQIRVDKPVDVTGFAENPVTINAGQTSRIFRFDESAGPINLRGLRLINGRTTSSGSPGGAIFSQSTDRLLLVDSEISGSTTAGSNSSGGGIYARGLVELQRTQVLNNRVNSGSSIGGGGIFSTNRVSLVDSIISGNFASRRGGGVHSQSSVQAVGSEIHDNEAGSDNGGGIFAYQFINLTASTVTMNTAGYSGGGIHTSYSSVSISRTEISGNTAGGKGGGVHAGYLSLESSHVNDNRSIGEGGGLRARDGATIENSTISGNRTTGSFNAHGGGISSGRYDLIIRSSTISGNQIQGSGKGAGVYFEGNGELVYIGPGYEQYIGANATITHSTITGNASVSGSSSNGAIYARSTYSTLNIDHSIVAGNTASGLARDVFAQGGSAAYSFLGTTQGIFIDSETVLFGNDPQLEPLANNGGATPTHAPQSGSPVIDAGQPIYAGAEDFDQRGAPFVRVAEGGVDGNRIDIGAFEIQPIDPSLLIVTTTVDELEFGNNAVSLREAIRSAELNNGPDTISFDPVIFSTPQSINLTLGELLIDSSLTIQGPGQDLLTIDALNGANGTFGDGDGFRVFTIDDGNAGNLINVTLSGLTVTGGDVSGDGGGISSVETLQLTEVSVSENFATSGGGGLFVDGETTIVRSLISGNQVNNNLAGGPYGYTASGAGILAYGNLTVEYSTVSHNIAESSGSFSGTYGGGLQIRDNAIIRHSTIVGNQAIGEVEGQGGGIFSLTDGAITLINSTLSGNSTSTPTGSKSDGGGILAQGNLTLESSTITGNFSYGASGQGGGIYSFGVAIDISNSVISGNSLTGGSNGIQLGSSTITADYSLFDDTSGLSASQVASIESGSGNLLGVDAMLGVLADNGGPTLSHLPLAGSPLINAGDPTINDTGGFDQRGNTFLRVLGGRIDIGAVETDATTLNSALELVVVDLNTDQRQAYTGDGQLTGTSDLALGNNGPRGVAASPDGTTLWIVDTDSNVYVYDGDGNYRTQWSFTGLSSAQGIATDGTDIWIVSNGSDDVHRFVGGATYTSGTHASDSSFSLVADNVNPFGLTTDGSNLWVVNDLSNQWKTFVYDLNGSPLGSWELDGGNRNARGITFDPTDPNDILIVNAGAQRLVYRYQDAKSLRSGSLTAAETILLDPFSDSPHGLGARAVAAVASSLSADFNSNNAVDGADFLLWQQSYSTAFSSPAIQTDAQTSGDTSVADQDGFLDAEDLALWHQQYGTFLASPTAAAESVGAVTTVQAPPQAVLLSSEALDQWFASNSRDVKEEASILQVDVMFSEIGRRPSYRPPPQDDFFRQLGDEQLTEVDHRQADDTGELSLSLSVDWGLL